MILRLGNDVVDFAEPGNIASAANPAFRRRVLSRSELAGIRPGDGRRLWAHWAAKEAVYKALKPAAPSLVFAHRQFELTSAAAFETDEGSGAGVVHVGSNRIDVMFCWTRDWVHCVTTHQPAAVWRVGEVGQLRREPRFAALANAEPLNDESIAARVLAHALLQTQGVNEATIRRTRHAGRAGRPVVVDCDGAPLAAVLSLSHDGRFVAAALR